MLRRRFLSALLVCAFLLPAAVFGQTTAAVVEKGTAAPAPAKVYSAPKAVIDKIRDEGMNRSQVMQTLSYLTDVIGGRLTNSPNMKRANEWTRDTMMKWGMQNAKLEPWGPFGRGWSLKGFSAQVGEPQVFPVIAYPKAWSTSTKGAVTGEVVYFDPKTDADLEKYKGKLNGKIVLISSGTRDVKADFDGMGTRRSDADLKKMADWAPTETPRQSRIQMTDEQRRAQRESMLFAIKRWNVLLQEGVAVAVDSSSKGSGGTVFVGGASVVYDMPADPANFNPSFRGGPRAWDKASEPKIVPQMTMAIEDYNRLVRMIRLGVAPKMTVDIRTQYYDEDLMGYNTIAEIPGTDPALKDEIVMLGAHLDSWHSSGGATDNAAGSAVAIEVMRILQAVGARPRRTIRLALWDGEEHEEYWGSLGYVRKHFGDPVTMRLRPEQATVSAYFNFDHGTGRVRGLYMQGNEAVRPIFSAFLDPFADLGASTLTIMNKGSTDHMPFTAVGIPAFTFIQDPIDYETRTHHSNRDVAAFLLENDLKQAAVVTASVVLHTANRDALLPRLPLPSPRETAK